MTDRDPRTDPMRGDVLKCGRVIRVVGFVSDTTVDFAEVSDDRSRLSWANKQETWRQWAAEATVIHKGEDL